MAAPRKIGKKRILIGVAVLAAILLVVFYYRVKTGRAVLLGGESTYTVARQDMTISVTESGSIKARNAVTIRSAVEGRTIIVSIVPEGTVLTEEDVANGKIIMELDTSSLKEDLNQQQIEYNTATADLTDARENLSIQKNQNESDVQQARLTVKFALMDLQKYTGQIAADMLVKKHEKQPVDSNDFTTLARDPNQLGGESLQKYRQLVSDINVAQSEYYLAINTLNWTEKLAAKNYVAKTELESDQLKSEKSKITHEQALTALDLFVRYEFPKDAHKFFSDFVEAERQLERAIATARAQLAQAEAKLNNAESKFALEKERLERVKRQIGASIIRAPSAGMVVYATQFSRGSRSRTSIEVGREVMEREEIMSIPNTSEMAVDAKVHETNIDKVTRGQIARIIVDAMPDQAFYGQVLKISPLPDPAAFMANPDLKVYTTEVSLEGGSMLRPGMSAKVEIVIAQLKDVLVVPVQCIANRSGKKICYVHSSSSEPREVKTGPYNDKFVQIIEGLSEGDKVLLNPPKVFEQTQNRPIPQGATPAVKEPSRPDGSIPNGQAGSTGSPQAGSERPRRMRPEGQTPTDGQQTDVQTERPRRQRPEGQVPTEGQPSDGQTERPRRQRPEGQFPTEGQQSDGQTERPRRQRPAVGEAGADMPAREPQQ
jgi:HlyD family secretion protein